LTPSQISDQVSPASPSPASSPGPARQHQALGCLLQHSWHSAQAQPNAHVLLALMGSLQLLEGGSQLLWHRMAELRQSQTLFQLCHPRLRLLPVKLLMRCQAMQLLAPVPGLPLGHEKTGWLGGAQLPHVLLMGLLRHSLLEN
jgi:hypothetical protein